MTGKEYSQQLSSLNLGTFIKCALIVAIVYLLPIGIDKWHSHDSSDKGAESKRSGSTLGLPVMNPSLTDYPEYSFKSMSKWNASKKELLANSENVRVTGNGYISKNDVSVDCILTEKGELIGRYANENGITLDVNGYIDSDNVLHIRLGHGSEISYWTLRPNDSKAKDTDSFAYKGEWGRKDKKTEMVFTIEK